MSSLYANYFGPADLSWWAWILLAVAFWIFANLASAYSDSTIERNKHTTFFWVVRATLIAGMVVSALVGVILFVKWVWNS